MKNSRLFPQKGRNKKKVQKPESDSESAEVSDCEQLDEEKEDSSEISDSSDGESTDEEAEVDIEPVSQSCFQV